MKIVSASRLAFPLLVLGIWYVAAELWRIRTEAETADEVARMTADTREKARLDARFEQLVEPADQALGRGQLTRFRKELEQIDAFLADHPPRTSWRGRRHQLVQSAENTKALDTVEVRDRLREEVADLAASRSDPRTLHRRRMDLAYAEANVGRREDAEKVVEDALAAGWASPVTLEIGVGRVWHPAEEVAQFYALQGHEERRAEVLERFVTWIGETVPDGVKRRTEQAEILVRLGERLLAQGEIERARTLFETAQTHVCAARPGSPLFAKVPPEKRERALIWLRSSARHAVYRLHVLGTGKIPEGLDPTGSGWRTSHIPELEAALEDFAFCSRVPEVPPPRGPEAAPARAPFGG